MYYIYRSQINARVVFTKIFIYSYNCEDLCIVLFGEWYDLNTFKVSKTDATGNRVDEFFFFFLQCAEQNSDIEMILMHMCDDL